jgi:hypothetical protein
MDQKNESGPSGWRMSLKEPPPPYIAEDSPPPEIPQSPSSKSWFQKDGGYSIGRPRWSISSSSSRKGSIDESSNLTAASLHAKLYSSDMKYAKVIIQLMAPKLEEGHLSYLEGSGWGYTFTDDTVY